MRQITPDQVIHIYWAGYWDPCQCDRLPAGVDYAVFDGAVNSGVAQSAIWLHRTMGMNSTGIIGPKTLIALADQDPKKIIGTMLDQRLQFLRCLKTWPTFGKGWEQRVRGVHRQALLLAQQQRIADETKS